jgi:hypothetical protein
MVNVCGYGTAHSSQCHRRSNGQWRIYSCGNKPLLALGGSLLKNSIILIAAIISIAFTTAADAKHRRAHHQQERVIHAAIVCDERGCSNQGNAAHARIPHLLDANGNGVVVGRRPDGCPRAFCGCEASLYLFGEIRAELNLASNWFRKFPRTSPAPGMVAVRNHHVLVLISHVGGSDWLVHDGNAGGGLTRDHIQSIRGHTIVNPLGSRSAIWLQ